MTNYDSSASGFFKSHWFGVFLSSVLAGLVAAFLYDHVSMDWLVRLAPHAASTAAVPGAQSSATLPRTEPVLPTQDLAPQNDAGRIHQVTAASPTKPHTLSLGADDVLVDPASGLMWQDDDFQDTEIKSPYPYWSSKPNGKLQDLQGAVRYCHALTLGGHSDWRLPDVNELRSAYRLKYRFAHVKPNGYWTSSVAPNLNNWFVQFNNGGSDYKYAPWYTLYVRCVREGRSG